MISEKGIELIKRWEGCRLKAYQDVAGTWTIGYGHTHGVYEGMTITPKEAEDLLKADLELANTAACEYGIWYRWNQNQIDAMTSFAFNLGTGALDQVTDCKRRTNKEISEKMLLYYNAGGVPVQGLVNRRIAEQQLFLTSMPGDEGYETQMLAHIKELYRLAQLIGWED